MEILDENDAAPVAAPALTKFSESEETLHYERTRGRHSFVKIPLGAIIYSMYYNYLYL